MKWHYTAEEEEYISDSERKCSVTDAYGRACTEEQRAEVARLNKSTCASCLRYEFCFVGTLIDAAAVGGRCV